MPHVCEMNEKEGRSTQSSFCILQSTKALYTHAHWHTGRRDYLLLVHEETGSEGLRKWPGIRQCQQKTQRLHLLPPDSTFSGVSHTWFPRQPAHSLQDCLHEREEGVGSIYSSPSLPASTMQQPFVGVLMWRTQKAQTLACGILFPVKYFYSLKDQMH